MRAIDLFSCIGGHTLGLQAAGIEVVGMCEINPQRRALLEQNFPYIRCHDDVKTLKPVRGAANLLTGGPPCQKTSKGAAIHGKRNGHSLWPYMLRVTYRLAPEWVVVEQPPGNTDWEAEVRDDMGGVGFFTCRVEFGANDCGAPHIRRRVFILAHRCRKRLEVAWSEVPREIERLKGSAATGNCWFEGPPGTVRVANGPSEWLDRNAAVEAIGDSNPPQMITVVGRAVLTAHEAQL
jgi:site-specific DNA-cytosine methylase